MKIDKPSTPLPSSLTGEGVSYAAAKGKAGQAPASPQPGGTSVSVGSTAAQLHNIESGLASAPVVNAAKVAEIKQAIIEGRFKVNPEVVSDRLLETVRDLIGNKT